jgi:drug/metabolite transporter (DMT)-like permease
MQFTKHPRRQLGRLIEHGLPTDESLRPVRATAAVIAAILATGVWSVSSLASSRGAAHLGGISANLVRLGAALPMLFGAAVLLGLTPWTVVSAPGGAWFVASGLVGMGICDILVLNAYARIGARLTVLLVNTIAVPTAALIGAVTLGEHPNSAQALAMLAIMVGLVFVLRPRPGDRADPLGIACAVLGAVTFGGSAVMSRLGFAAAVAEGAPIHWLDSTVLRVAAGLVLCVLAFIVATPFDRRWRDGPGRWGAALPWLLLNACLGPGLGLVCYQWALASTPAAQVHAMISIIPLVVLIITWVSGEERPGVLAVVGTVLAVIGVAGLALLRT